MEPGRLQKSLEHLSWDHAAGAVLDVLRENQRERGRYKPASDKWSVNSGLRHRIWKRARHFWCKRTGQDPTEWPYSVDWVADQYMKFRKRNETDLVEFEQEINAAHKPI